jgi:hypothetical protein
MASSLSGREVAVGPPPKAELLGGMERELIFGCSMAFGPSGDVREGIASFHAWNLDGQETNAGALYLTIESKPPFGQQIVVTRLPIPLNPTEYWWAAYSRTGRRFIPA